MPDYRYYRLDPQSGHITAGEDLDAADDEAAIAAVRREGHDVPVELWSGSRKVAHLDAPPQPAAFFAEPRGRAAG